MDNVRARRINTISRLLHAKRYLEIGVCQGDTFLAVDNPYKIAVDPHFQFDFRTFQTDSVKFYELTSDAFFRTTPRDSFDLIFLDGLHTFEQTLRDFINSLSFAHDKTVWIIDDTFPNDNFAALPDQERCYRGRRVLGNGDCAWMGDVYKVVYFIRNVMRFYHYRTFSGHGQTVVWKDPSIFSDGLSIPADKIGTMTYEDMIDTFQLMMHIETDEKIYADIKAFYAR